jgi:hypothetical protein
MVTFLQGNTSDKEEARFNYNVANLVPNQFFHVAAEFICFKFNQSDESADSHEAALTGH